MRNEKKTNGKLLRRISGMVALAMSVLVMGGCAVSPSESGSFINSEKGDKMTLVKAEYPELREPLYEEYSDYDEYDKAWTAYREQEAEFLQNKVYANEIPSSYFSETMKVFLLDNDGGNVAFSPVNAYMALAMVAETADGASRQQILDVLGAESLVQLRNHANALWRSCYNNSALNETLLANSMWLADSMSYKTETLQGLVDYYYASAFSGEMGSADNNKLLQDWLNENTGGLLADETKNVEFDAATVFGLASTVYYKAQWYDEFNAANNTQGIFTSANGTEQQAEFMNFSDDMYTYRKGEDYIATYLNIEDGDKMWFILPDEGMAPEQLIENGALNEFLYGGVKDTPLNCEMHFSMPKFDITSQNDFIKGMREIGITDIFDSGKADFSPLTDTEGVFINEVSNAVRVAVDEKGVSAASYIVMAYAGAAMPEEYPVIEFRLDRPFIFVIENNDGMVLFCGIVNSVE